MREHLDADDPHHRLWLPGRRWMAQRTLARTAAALFPTPTASDWHGKSGPNADSPDSRLANVDSLLPTPQAADGERGPDYARQRERVASHGSGGDDLTTTVAKLMPTPTAEDGERGRHGAGTDRLGGTTFEGDLLPTPAARDAKGPHMADRQGGPDLSRAVLLPMPVANEENPGAGGELRAALVHGEGRRNETGVDTMGRPNEGRPSRLLPTPTVADARSGANSTAGRSDPDSKHHSGTTMLDALRTEIGVEPRLLPTPQAADGDGGRQERSAMGDGGKRPSGQKATLPLPTAVEMRETITDTPFTAAEGSDQLVLLPTPDTRALTSPGLEAAGGDVTLLPTPTCPAPHDSLESAGRPRPPREGYGLELPNAVASHPEVSWGVYEPAVRRWEAILGRDAPAPTDEKGRLDPPFVGWMLGYPGYWFELDPPLARTAQLRALGNSVQVQAGEAVGFWLRGLLESGLLD